MQRPARVLLRPLKEAHLDTHRLHRLFCKRNAEDVRLWTNPGEVKAATSNKSDNVVKILTADAMVDVNPYSKPLLHIKPTRVGAADRGSPTSVAQVAY